MRPILRNFVIGVAVVSAIGVIFVGWSILALGACDYRIISERVSPSGRYVAELYGADCGMGSYFDVVMLRDVSAFELPKLDGSPPGTIITSNFDTMDDGNDMFWDGEAMFVIEYVNGDGPDLDRTEWGGVRIEKRRAAPAE
ncbi:MAG: hypothetical protein ABL871_17220 [Terricaulis sp.]